MILGQKMTSENYLSKLFKCDENGNPSKLGSRAQALKASV